MSFIYTQHFKLIFTTFTFIVGMFSCVENEINPNFKTEIISITPAHSSKGKIVKLTGRNIINDKASFNIWFNKSKTVIRNFYKDNGKDIIEVVVPNLNPGNIKVKAAIDSITSNKFDFTIDPSKVLKAIYWSSYGTICKGEIDKDNISAQILYESNNDDEDFFLSLDMHHKNKEIYFIGKHTIYKLNTTPPSTPEVIYTSNLNEKSDEYIFSHFQSISIDETNNHIYVTYDKLGEGSQLIRFNLDGSNKKVLYEKEKYTLLFEDLEVDEINQKIYWVESLNHRIMSLDLSLNNIPIPLYENQLDYPLGIALNPALNLIYILNKAETCSLRQGNMDGSIPLSTVFLDNNNRYKLKNAESFLEIDLENDWLYFDIRFAPYPEDKNKYNEQLVRCSLNGIYIHPSIDRLRDNIKLLDAFDIVLAY